MLDKLRGIVYLVYENVSTGMGFIVICIVIHLPILSVLMFVSKTYTVI